MKTSIIFDYNGTLYDDGLIPGTMDMLMLLQGTEIPMYLIAKGDHERANQIQDLGLMQFFQQVIINEKKNPEDYKNICRLAKEKAGEPVNVIVIGDRIREEIAHANGIKEEMRTEGILVFTIWVRRGKFAGEEPETPEQKPTVVLSNTTDLADLICKAMV